jgi:hypothetical protein
MPIKFLVSEMPQVWYECPFYSKTTGTSGTMEHCSCGHFLCDCEYFNNECNPELCNWLKVIESEN